MKQSKRYEGIDPEKTLSKWERHYNSCLDEDEYRYCVNVDSCQWNYDKNRVEFIEAEEISEESYKKYPKEDLFNYNGDINKEYLRYEAERKKLLFLWRCIKELKGTLYIVFWSQRKDSYKILQILNIDDNDKKTPIKYDVIGKRPLTHEEFKNWIKEWNKQGKNPIQIIKAN